MEIKGVDVDIQVKVMKIFSGRWKYSGVGDGDIQG